LGGDCGGAEGGVLGGDCGGVEGGGNCGGAEGGGNCGGAEGGGNCGGAEGGVDGGGVEGGVDGGICGGGEAGGDNGGIGGGGEKGGGVLGGEDGGFGRGGAGERRTMLTSLVTDCMFTKILVSNQVSDVLSINASYTLSIVAESEPKIRHNTCTLPGSIRTISTLTFGYCTKMDSVKDALSKEDTLPVNTKVACT